MVNVVPKPYRVIYTQGFPDRHESNGLNKIYITNNRKKERLHTHKNCKIYLYTITLQRSHTRKAWSPNKTTTWTINSRIPDFRTDAGRHIENTEVNTFRIFSDTNITRLQISMHVTIFMEAVDAINLNSYIKTTCNLLVYQSLFLSYIEINILR